MCRAQTYFHAGEGAEAGAGAAGIPPQSVAVIIATRNEKPELLLHTITSIFTNSGEELKAVVIVDDMSDSKVKDWPTWDPQSSPEAHKLHTLMEQKCAGGNVKQCLRFVRPKKRLGVAGAKDFGAHIFSVAQGKDHFHDNTVSTLVFLDGHVVVSPQWLAPLVHTLSLNPTAVAYPALDVIDPASGGFVKAGNVVGGFSWALDFRWEDASNASRLPSFSSSSETGTGTGTGTGSEDDVLLSPAAPGIFAIKTSYYTRLDGLDTNLKPYGLENIELSLRVWRCGGSVLRQPCSRVAHMYRNVFQVAAASAGNAVSQQDVDRNVMLVAGTCANVGLVCVSMYVYMCAV